MARTNAPGLNVPDRAVHHIETLLKYLDQFGSFIEASRTLQSGITSYEVLHPLSEKLGIPYQDLEDSFTALENLRYLEIEYSSASEAIERLANALPSDLSKRFVAKRDEILAVLSKYVDDSPVAITLKAQRLSYFYEHIFRDSEIITDVRPIFDTKGENILEIIISHSLSVAFSSSSRTERIHFTMDAGDVLKLRRACDRAILKANALKKAFTGSDRGWSVRLLRDNNDAS
jgi:septum formation topological specificity factor MinE